jgi:hypothetical protein
MSSLMYIYSIQCVFEEKFSKIIFDVLRLQLCNFDEGKMFHSAGNLIKKGLTRLKTYFKSYRLGFEAAACTSQQIFHQLFTFRLVFFHVLCC